MIHNPRHRYCMDCGQRLMGPHVCPNETEHSDPTRTQIFTMTSRTQPTEIENRRTRISGALSALLKHLIMIYPLMMKQSFQTRV